MSEAFDPEQVYRWDCDAGQFLDVGTVAVMVGAEDGEYVYAWQYDKLLALYREAVRGRAVEEDHKRAHCLAELRLVGVEPDEHGGLRNVRAESLSKGDSCV